jgi:hypothetical protein
MKCETEKGYMSQSENWDDARAWGDGSMYANGMTDSNSLADDSALVSTTPSGMSTNWADAFKSAIPVLASVYQQRQLTKLNVARTQRNLAPMTAQEYANYYQPPSAQVQVGATADTKRLMLYGALAVAALVGLRAAKVI